MPTHMGIWDKWVLGWADPRDHRPGDEPSATSARPDLPHAEGHRRTASRSTCRTRSITLAEPHSGSEHVVLRRRPGLGRRQAQPAPSPCRPAPTRSSGCGTTTSSRRTGTSASSRSPPTAAPPGPSRRSTTRPATRGHHRRTATPTRTAGMADFGDKKYGLTGDTDGWRHDYVDLTAVRRARPSSSGCARPPTRRSSSAAGSPTTSRSPAAVPRRLERRRRGRRQRLDRHGRHLHRHAPAPGWHDRHRHPGARRSTTWPSGATSTASTRACSTPTTRPTRDSGAWKVEKIKYNAPGMLVWYRDTDVRQRQPGHGEHLTALPSFGAKGGLLHRRLALRPAAAHGRRRPIKDPTTLKNLPVAAAVVERGVRPARRRTRSRSAWRGADEPYSEYCTTFGPQPAVSTFTDAQGLVPGHRVARRLACSAGTSTPPSCPSKGQRAYTTRVVNPDGSPAQSLYGADLGFASWAPATPVTLAWPTASWCRCSRSRAATPRRRSTSVPPKPR